MAGRPADIARQTHVSVPQPAKKTLESVGAWAVHEQLHCGAGSLARETRHACCHRAQPVQLRCDPLGLHLPPTSMWAFWPALGPPTYM
jgi:hypothetical protein